MSQSLHVIFGAGQIGAGLARTLLARGHRVRVVRRSTKPVGPGIEVVSADATDVAQAIAASAGASVIYHCMNPSSYSAEAWEREFPAMGEAVIAAAIAEQARLVCLDNVYAYGIMDGARSESSPMQAEGPKGRVRIAWHERLHQAAATQGLRWVAGRGGDFFGPGTGDQSFISMNVARGLGRGSPALLIGDPSQPHSFSFAPDVVESLVALGEAESDIEGRAWHVPVITIAPRDLVRRIAKAQGRRGWSVVIPVWALKLLSPVVPLFHDLLETTYQWDRAFRVDDSDFRERFPQVGSTLDEAVGRIIAELGADEATGSSEKEQPSPA